VAAARRGRPPANKNEEQAKIEASYEASIFDDLSDAGEDETLLSKEDEGSLSEENKALRAKIAELEKDKYDSAKRYTDLKESSDRRYTDLEERLNRMEFSGGIGTGISKRVSLFCATPLAPGIVLEATFDNGTRVTFDKIFQRKDMSLDMFITFASSSKGGLHLANRNIIVGGDIPDDVAETWGVKYRDGEVYNKKTFDSILDMPVDQLTETYKLLCKSHRINIARCFVDAFQANERHRVTKNKVAALNEIDGLLVGLQKEMTEMEAADL